MANEGSYPENARGLAMNGAEVVYRGPYPHPHAGNGLFEIQNRARAKLPGVHEYQQATRNATGPRSAACQMHAEPTGN